MAVYGSPDSGIRHKSITVSLDASKISIKGNTSPAGEHTHKFVTDKTGNGKPFEVSPVRVPLYVWYRVS